jgi:hypothetical protein
MANPFLFDEVPAEVQNPFLINDPPAPAEPANPFLDGGMGMGMQQQQQPQPNFGGPDMAANPFASYGAPVYNDPNAQMGNYYYQQQQQQQPQQTYMPQQQQAYAPQQPFVAPQQAYTAPQQQHPHQHPQQQFAGHFGSYTQVTADSFSEPIVSAAIVTQPDSGSHQPNVANSTFNPPEPAHLTGVAAFGIEVEEPAPAPVFVPPPEIEKAVELPPPPPPQVEAVAEPVVQQMSVEEALPPPPVETVQPVIDEPLPAPPEEPARVSFLLPFNRYMGDFELGFQVLDQSLFRGHVSRSLSISWLFLYRLRNQI